MTLKRLTSKNKLLCLDSKRYLGIIVGIMTLSGLGLGQALSALAATTNYPPYFACDLVAIPAAGSGVACNKTSGWEWSFTKGNSQGAADGIVYMYGASQSLSGFVTLSSISANIKGNLKVNSGDTGAVGQVAAYLSDPACTKPWRCAKSGIVSTLWEKSITSGSYGVNALKTGPNKTYSLGIQLKSYHVVAYLNSQISGYSATGTYSDLYGYFWSGNSVGNFKITKIY